MVWNISLSRKQTLLICHHETTNVTYHPIDICPDCQATGFIPRLEKHLMTKSRKEESRQVIKTGDRWF